MLKHSKYNCPACMVAPSKFSFPCKCCGRKNLKKQTYAPEGDISKTDETSSPLWNQVQERTIERHSGQKALDFSSKTIPDGNKPSLQNHLQCAMRRATFRGQSQDRSGTHLEHREKGRKVALDIIANRKDRTAQEVDWRFKNLG